MLPPFLLLSALFPVQAAAQNTPPYITAPQAGQALQGMVTVTGASALEEFALAEIAFAYADDATGTWFLIASSDQPVIDGFLATWDTTTITDGTYALRMRVLLADGTNRETPVPALGVRT